MRLDAGVLRGLMAGQEREDEKLPGPERLIFPKTAFHSQLPKGMPLLVRVQSNQFHIEGVGAVRHCHRAGTKYIVGLEFTERFALAATGWRGRGANPHFAIREMIS